MAFESLGPVKSIVSAFNAAAANGSTVFPSAQFTFVYLNSSGQLVLPAAGKAAIGVLQDKPAVGEAGTICGPGAITKIQANGTFAAGQFVTTDVNGCAVAATSGLSYLGQALSAGVQGFLADIVFQPSGFVTP